MIDRCPTCDRPLDEHIGWDKANEEQRCERTFLHAVCTSPPVDWRARAMAAERRETSASIAAWQNETFGPATTDLKRVMKTWAMISNAMSAVAWETDLSVSRPNLSRAIRAAEELAELIELLSASDDDPKAPREVADIDIVLRGIDAAHGVERSEQVDAKMVINRARTWHVTGDGHGQHVKEPK